MLIRQWFWMQTQFLVHVSWPVFTSVVVPLLAAGLAAAVVGWQIRKSNEYRIEDRRASGVKALTEMFIGESMPVMEHRVAGSAEIMRNTKNLIDAYADLSGLDTQVAKWAAGRRNRMIEISKEWAALPEARIPSNALGDKPAEVGTIAAESMDTLVSWMRGDLPTQWFIDEVKRAEAADH